MEMMPNEMEPMEQLDPMQEMYEVNPLDEQAQYEMPYEIQEQEMVQPEPQESELMNEYIAEPDGPVIPEVVETVPRGLKLKLEDVAEMMAAVKAVHLEGTNPDGIMTPIHPEHIDMSHEAGFGARGGPAELWEFPDETVEPNTGPLTVEQNCHETRMSMPGKDLSIRTLEPLMSDEEIKHGFGRKLTKKDITGFREYLAEGKGRDHVHFAREVLRVLRHHGDLKEDLENEC